MVPEKGILIRDSRLRQLLDKTWRHSPCVARKKQTPNWEVIGKTGSVTTGGKPVDFQRLCD